MEAGKVHNWWVKFAILISASVIQKSKILVLRIWKIGLKMCGEWMCANKESIEVVSIFLRGWICMSVSST